MMLLNPLRLSDQGGQPGSLTLGTNMMLGMALAKAVRVVAQVIPGAQSVAAKLGTGLLGSAAAAALAVGGAYLIGDRRVMGLQIEPNTLAAAAVLTAMSDSVVSPIMKMAKLEGYTASDAGGAWTAMDAAYYARMQGSYPQYMGDGMVDEYNTAVAGADDTEYNIVSY